MLSKDLLYIHLFFLNLQRLLVIKELNITPVLDKTQATR
jgi:hypothetical protein